MKPQRAQRNTLCPQKEWIKGKDIGRRRRDSFVEDEVIFELKALETLARIYEAIIYGGAKKRGMVEECPSKAVQRREKGINHLEGTEGREEQFS